MGPQTIQLNLRNTNSGNYFVKIEYGYDYIENQLLIIKK